MQAAIEPPDMLHFQDGVRQYRFQSVRYGPGTDQNFVRPFAKRLCALHQQRCEQGLAIAEPAVQGRAGHAGLRSHFLQ